jgi:uncharacterized coiled-coil protein SlyX
LALFNRVIQTRRSRAREARPADAPQDVEARLASLENDVARLESLIEALQDAIHRETMRTRADLRALEAKTQPAEIARALSEDIRKRGL